MTLNSKREYIEVMRTRYLQADKKEKGQILDEFIKVTGYHRKAAIRVLTPKVKSAINPKGRPPQYKAVLPSLRSIWEASDRL